MNHSYMLFVVVLSLNKVFACYTNSNSKQLQNIQLETGRLTLIKPTKTCLISLADSFQLHVCYNYGECRKKDVMFNESHYKHVFYCQCPVVSKFN